MKKTGKITRIFYGLLAGIMIAASLFGTGLTAFAGNQNESRNGVVAVVLHLKGGMLLAWPVNSSGELVNTPTPYKSLGDVDTSFGSGFFIGKTGENPQYIVTNAHVVNDYMQTEGKEVYIKSYRYGQFTDGSYYMTVYYAPEAELRVYYDDNDYDIAYVDEMGDMNKVDLAVLKLRTPTDKRIPLQIKRPDDSMVGVTDVWALGFPGSTDNDYTNASRYSTTDVSVSPGGIKKIAYNSGVGVERIETSATIHHGNSGGPLVTSDGAVIGVCTNVSSEIVYNSQVEAQYYALSGNTLADFLDKHNYKYEMASAGSGAPTDNGTQAPSDSSATQPVSEPIVTPPAQKNSGLGVLAVVVIVIIAAAAAVVIFVVKGKQKGGTASGQSAQPGQPMQPAPAMRALVRSLSPQHNGMTIVLHNVPIMIGRDPASCKIIYKEGTQGVSGKHCTVAYQAATNEFLVTDLRSTYGTYLMNGQRLTPNVPVRLRSGDSFYVGDKANVIRLELG